MLVTLSGFELEDALKMYLEKQFNRKVEVLVDEGDSVVASVELKEVSFPTKVETEEQNKTYTSTELDEFKPKRTRRKRVEVLDENDNSVSETIVGEEEIKDEKTKYANLPRLNQEDQAKYTKILTLLNTNPRNKNRLQLEELSTNLSEDLRTVLNASEHYQDWLEYCKEQDSEAVMNEILKPEEPVNEPVKEFHEDKTLCSMEELNKKENQPESLFVQEPEKPKKTLFGSSDSSIAKSGSIFPSQPSRRVF